MTYDAKVTLKFDSTWSYTGGIYDAEILPEEHITFEVPAEDLNTTQLFQLFNKFMLSMGHTEKSIASGACYLAFNDMRSIEDMNKLMEEYEMQDKQTYSDKDYDELYQKYEKLQKNLSYSDQSADELDSMPMFVEFNDVTEQNLNQAYQVCNDCGNKYGNYVAGVSSHWMGKCDVCGEAKSVTEARDFDYLKKGIEELSK